MGETKPILKKSSATNMWPNAENSFKAPRSPKKDDNIRMTNNFEHDLENRETRVKEMTFA